jgi:sulfopyruvate decarboxylase subunit alpha
MWSVAEQNRFAQRVLRGLKAADVSVVAALPDSLLYGVYWGAAHDPAFQYFSVTNEGEGASICAGAWLGGKRSVLIMEDSGLRVASESLARLGLSSGVPVTMLMPYRGDFGEEFDWGINHGITLEPMLRALRIPYVVVRQADEIEPAIARAVTHSVTSLYHTAVIFGQELLSEPPGILSEAD